MKKIKLSKFIIFKFLLKVILNFMESLILAQSERWRRA